MKQKFPQISDSEYEIMKIIWANYPIKSQEIILQVDKENHWSEKTIKTLISRLLKKEAIKYTKDGKEYVYSPLLKESDYKHMETKSFLNRVYNGSLNAMVAHFITDEKVSQEELKELRELLLKEKSK